MYGNYTGLKPTLTVSEPELIKAILIKDFPSFVNRRELTTYHPMVNNGLFFTDAEVWKRLRSVSSPTFTTGKLKRFRPLIHWAIGNLETYFDRLTASGEVMKDTRTTLVGFTLESIASTMFAAQTGSNDDRKSMNAFVEYGKTISDVSNFQAVSYFVMPGWFNRIFRIEHPFNAEGIEFYTNVIKAIISEQKKKNLKEKSNGSTSGTNMVELLVNAAQNKYEESSYEGLTASMDRGKSI